MTDPSYNVTVNDKTFVYHDLWDPKLPASRPDARKFKECSALALTLCCDSRSTFSHVLPPMALVTELLCPFPTPPVLIPLCIRTLSGKALYFVVDCRRPFQHLAEVIEVSQGIPTMQVFLVFNGRNVPRGDMSLEDSLRLRDRSVDSTLTADGGAPLRCGPMTLHMIIPM